MKTVKLTFIAAAALLMASCSSSKNEDSNNDTAVIEQTDDTVALPAGEMEVTEVEEVATAENDDEAEATSSKSSSADVDKLLDEYESYMNQTIKLVKKAQNGDMSAMTEYASLLEKAQSLQEKLEDFKGEMTSAQAARLTKIAAKASQAMMYYPN